MGQTDARYQTLQQSQERREQVIRLYKRCIKDMELVQMTGLSYPKPLDLHEQSGWLAFQPAHRGCTRAMPVDRSTSKWLISRSPSALSG